MACVWSICKKEKATSGIIPSLMAAAEVFDGVPVEYPEEFAREFTCHVIGAFRIDFKVWTDGEPPTPEAVASQILTGVAMALRMASL